MSHPFDTRSLPAQPDTVAPDGSNVRILSALTRGSMAHFELLPGKVSTAVAHRTVEEIWYILGGAGEMWRKQGDREEIVTLAPGISLSVPLGTAFQFRTTGTIPLTAVAITMPPWPGDNEAHEVDGYWPSAQ